MQINEICKGDWPNERLHRYRILANFAVSIAQRFRGEALQKRLTSLFMIVFLVELVGCTSSCDASSSSQQAVKTRRKPGSTFTAFPSVSVGSLPPEQLAGFTQLANEEICPCKCPTSFAGCLQADTKCKAAPILGQWVVDTMADGIPADRLSAWLAREIGLGYGGRPQTIDLSGVHSKGAKNPKLTIVEFADFDCSHCKTAAPVLEAFVKKYEDSISFVFKYFPRGTAIGKMAAQANEAAARQGKFWEMHDALFKIDILSEAKIIEAANSIGLKMDRFNKERKDTDIMSKVDRSTQEAVRLGLSATPSFFFVGPKGDARPYYLPPDLSGFEARMAMELARDESSCN